MPSGSRAYGFAFAAIAVAVIAFLSVGALKSEKTASASNPALNANLLAASLSLSPSTAIPNQSIGIVGNGFTTVATSGGGGAAGVHRITGSGSSYISIAGITLGSPHANYPIDLDSSGNFVANAIVPVTAATLTAGSVTVSVTDDAGVTATATLTVPQRTLTLDPISSHRGSEVTATGAGFPADNPGLTGSFPVAIDYAGTQIVNVTPDSSGAFVTTFSVPLGASIPSTNTVTATVIARGSKSTASHSVPSASITASPTESSSGSDVTVTASNFPAFAPVSSLTIGSVQVLPSGGINTDKDGAFTSSILVPDLPNGNQVLQAIAGGLTAISSITITPPLVAPTATPSPTPTPVPVVGPAIALDPLMVNDNLVRVWNFNNSSKTWTFFDPRPAFASVNTIIDMASGQVYWINVLSSQTVTLNGQERALSTGWNLLSW